MMKRIIKFLTLVCVCFFVSGCSKENNEKTNLEKAYEEVSSWIKDNYDHLEVTSDLTFPTSYSDSSFVLTWNSLNSEVLSSEGKVTRQNQDTDVTLECTISDGDENFIVEVLVIVKAKEVDDNLTLADVEEWLIANYNNKVIAENIDLPKNYGNYSLQWMSFSNCLNEEGEFTAPILDEEFELLCTIKGEAEKKDVFLVVNAKGYGTVFDAVVDEVKKTIGENITYNFRFPQDNSKYNATIRWETDNPSVLDITLDSFSSVITRPIDNDEEVNLTCYVTIDRETKEYVLKVNVLKLTSREKAIEVKGWLDQTFTSFSKIDANIDLPENYLALDATISWNSSFSNIVSSKGEFSQPLSNTSVTLIATIKIDDYELDVSYAYDVDGYEFVDTWEAIEVFLNMINYKEIQTQHYQTFGSKTIDVINYGYLPFYDTNNSNVTVKILEYTYGRIRTNIKKTSTEYIVVHDTGNVNKGADATAHWNYLNNLNNDENNGTSVSWHYTVDESSIFQNVPLDEVAWHAGDGRREWGSTYFNTSFNKQSITGGNVNGIGIETCVNEGSEYNNTMRNTAKLVAELLLEFDLSFDRIKQHNDFSGKDCPMTMRHANRWDEFLFLVELEYFAKTSLKGVTFEWKSLSPTVLNDRGEIISKLGLEANVSYEVKVSYNGTSKVYNYTSTVLALASK